MEGTKAADTCTKKRRSNGRRRTYQDKFKYQDWVKIASVGTIGVIATAASGYYRYVDITDINTLKHSRGNSLRKLAENEIKSLDASARAAAEEKALQLHNGFVEVVQKRAVERVEAKEPDKVISRELKSLGVDSNWLHETQDFICKRDPIKVNSVTTGYSCSELLCEPMSDDDVNF